MGACCLKKDQNYVVEEKRMNNGDKDVLENTAETKANSYSDDNRGDLANARQLSSLIVKPGEEDLFSK